MRKTVMITALCSFLLFMLAGYYLTLWMGERDKRMEAAQANPAVQTKQTIRENTKIVYQYFYSRDKVTKEQIELAPVFLQGLDMEQLKSVYTGWQVVLFSPEKVILRCKIEGLSSETYILGEDDGFLAVFYEDAQKGIHLKEKTELPVSALPEGEAAQLKEGIRVTGEENLAKLLADLMS
ncbi:BofC C-terminal domain-containing protein [Anaerotignum sp.]